ncbi:5'-methylthioadenosine/S-adenosylhomocysteine nucleosidase [Paramyrothecium foliicola]|nr:5'-methylthioadenosine/S-adenosylhomocysteine nucleosidase [Paramyrothecium foliicola]
MPKLEDYTIIFFCPLVVEQQAVCLMLDEVDDETLERSVGQTILYTLGTIKSRDTKYNVAIAGYPAGEVGLGISGSMVSEVMRDFPNLEFGLLVGIAAGIPSPTRDIRLGDVAIAVPNQDNPGVIGYDLVKVEEGEVRLKQWQNSTHSLLRSAITRIRVLEGRPELSFTRHLKDLENAAGFQRPEDDGRRPQAHYGTILSGNGVIKSEAKRDELRDKYDGIAIEMEAAGMMTRLPLAVIRGISDFADANKADTWHPYAALTAAAYARELISRVGPLKKTVHETQSFLSPDSKNLFYSSMPEKCRFVGRHQFLAQLDSWHRDLPQKTIVAVYGMSGVGKSQLVAEFIRRQLQRDSSRRIFWIKADSQEVFIRSVLALLKMRQGPQAEKPELAQDHHEQRHALVRSFFAELKDVAQGKWVLVIDGISDDPCARQVRHYIETLTSGLVILVSRSKSLISGYHNKLELIGLEESDALQLLQSEIEETLQGKMLQLCSMVKCHPLALRLAASAMNYYPMSLAQYVKKWGRRELDREDNPMNSDLLRSFEISLEELVCVDALAGRLLKLFGFLSHVDLWFDTTPDANLDDYPDWVRLLVYTRRFPVIIRLLRSRSLIELTTKEHQIYEIHPAIHEFARRKARDEEQDFVRDAISLVAAQVPRSNDKDFVKKVRRLEPHLEQCQIYLEQNRAGRGLDLVELEQFGNLFRYLGRHEEAVRLYQGILKALSREDDPDDFTRQMFAGIQNNLGLVLHSQRQYRQALQLFQQSCKLQSSIMREDDGALYITRYNGSRSLLMLGELDRSFESLLQTEAYFSSVLQSGADKVDDRWPNYFRVLNDIGELQLRRGDIDLAEQSFQKAFAGLRNILTETHPFAFTVRLNIGRICTERSQYGNAKKIFECIIYQYTAWWGRAHNETMRAVAELADTHMRHGEAKKLMGDGGEFELEIAKELWAECFAYHRDMYGIDSDTAVLAKERMEALRALCLDPELNPYSIYFDIKD